MGSDRYVLRISQPASEGQVDAPSQPPVKTTADSESAAQETEAPIAASGDNEQIVALREKFSGMEETLLSRNLDNEKLQEQIFLLEKQVEKAVVLLGVKDEALALAQQEAAVYGAALEALESTSGNEQESVNQGDEGLDAQKAEVSATAVDVLEDPEPVLVQEEKIVDRIAGFVYEESNRPVLLVVGAALLLLLLFVTMRRKRFQRGRGVLETSRVIDTTVPTAGPADGSDVATKLDLARAYGAMGDHAAARELLSEVRVHGDSEQKAEAQRLNDTIGD